MNGGSQDPYPTRLAVPSAWIGRREPVLHGGFAQPGPLPLAALEGFHRDGYAVCRGLFSPAEAADLLAAVQEAASAEGSVRIDEPEATVARSLFAVHAAGGPLAAALRDRRLVGAAEQILADRVAFHQSRVNLKPAFDGREFWWHSDFETWHAEDGLPGMRVLSAMIMLTVNNAANGPLLVIPGSHAVFVPCVGVTPQDHHATSLRRQEYGLPDRGAVAALARAGGVEAILGAPGDTVLFDGNLLHGSAGNISPQPRCNLFAVYNAVSNAPLRAHDGETRRPVHIAEPHAQAIEAAGCA